MTNTEDRPTPSMSKEQFELLVDLAGKLMDEARTCASGRTWRGALILLGCSMEASLLAMVGCLEIDLREAGHWPTTPKLGRPTIWSLTTLIAVARKAGWVETTLPLNSFAADPSVALMGGVGDAVDFIRLLRDAFAHPGRHVRELPWLDSADERVMRPTYEVAEGILGTLFERLATVWESLELPEDT